MGFIENEKSSYTPQDQIREEMAFSTWNWEKEMNNDPSGKNLYFDPETKKQWALQ